MADGDGDVDALLRHKNVFMMVRATGLVLEIVVKKYSNVVIVLSNC